MENLEKELAIYSGNVIKELRKQMGLTQQEFGKLIGVSNSAVANYEKGYRAPLQNTLFRIADVCNVSINTLFPDVKSTSLIEKLVSTSKQLTPPRQHKVYTFAQHQLDEQNGVINIDTIKEDSAEYITKGLYGRLSAGTGQQIFDNPVEDVKVPSAIIPDEPYDIMLKIVGDSMQPAFEDGEYVFIKLTKEIRSGQFAAIIVDGEAFLKKVYVEEDQMRLVSLNKNYEDIIVNEYSNVEVVGTVVL